MIRLDTVTKRYDDLVAVDRVSLEIPRGGMTALIGGNGAGKSTVLSLMSRLQRPDEGTVTIDGEPLFDTPGDEVAKKISILRQENHMTARLTVAELVSFGRFPYSRGRLTGEDRMHVDRALEFFELTEIAHRPIHQLSGGQRQRAFVAMVLCQDTDYILLDEPLNNLDMRHAAEIMKLLRRLVAEQGKSIVLVLHDINYASFHSDRIVAMREGRIVHDGAPETVMDPDCLRAIFDMDIPIETLDGRRVGLYY